MPIVKASTSELEIRVDDRGKHTLWFKGERVPGVVRISTEQENGSRAEISVTAIPSGVYWDDSRKILCDAAGVVTGHNAMLGWLRRKDEFPAYVKPIPTHAFFVPELKRFFDLETFETCGLPFDVEWFKRAAEFPQKHLTDAITETYTTEPPQYYYDRDQDTVRDLNGDIPACVPTDTYTHRQEFPDFFKQGPIPKGVYYYYYDGKFYFNSGVLCASQEWWQNRYGDRRTEFPVAVMTSIRS